MADEPRSRASLAMDAYADGDAGAFAELYDELSTRLYRYVRRMTARDDVANDIVQQVFLNMHEARARFARGARVEPWAYAIARRLTIDWARRRRPEAGFVPIDDATLASHEDPERSAAASELTSALESELENVPAPLREAFLLVRLEGLSTEDAADVLGTTPVAVKVRAHRAGVRLRPRLLRFLSREDVE